MTSIIDAFLKSKEFIANHQINTNHEIIIWLPENNFIYSQHIIDKYNIYIVSYKNFFSIINYLYEKFPDEIIKNILTKYKNQIADKNITSISFRCLLLKDLIREIDEKEYFFLINPYSFYYENLIIHGQLDKLIFIEEFKHYYPIKLMQNHHLYISLQEYDNSFLNIVELKFFPNILGNLNNSPVIINLYNQSYFNNPNYFFFPYLINLIKYIICGIDKIQLKKTVEKLLLVMGFNEKKEKTIEILKIIEDFYYKNPEIHIKTLKTNDSEDKYTFIINILVDYFKNQINNEKLLLNKDLLLSIFTSIYKYKDFIISNYELNHLETLRQDNYSAMTAITIPQIFSNNNIDKQYIIEGINSLDFFNYNSMENFLLNILNINNIKNIKYYQNKKNVTIKNTNLDSLLYQSMEDINSVNNLSNIYNSKNNNSYIIRLSMETMLNGNIFSILMMILGNYEDNILKINNDLSNKLLLPEDKLTIYRAAIEEIEFYSFFMGKNNNIQIKIFVPLNNIYLNKTPEETLDIFIITDINLKEDSHNSIANLVIFFLNKQMKTSTFSGKVHIVDRKNFVIYNVYNCQNAGYYIHIALEEKLQSILQKIIINEIC